MSPAVTPFGQVRQEFLAYLKFTKGYRDTTCYNYESDLRIWDRWLGEAAPIDLERYVATLSRNGTGPHAVARMFERGISRDDVLTAIEQGDVIADYPDDRPAPSRLLLAYPGARPLHVVVARDPASGVCYVITAYSPDPTIWSADFTARRTQ